MKLVAWGFGLTAAVSGVAWWIWGPHALLPTAAFGLLATGLQAAALALLAPAWDAPFSVLARRWAAGVALRVGGVVLFAAAVVANRTLFPPVPAALGYLGVLVPLLFLETRSLWRRGG